MKPVLTRINQQMKKQGVPFQLVRGRGYYYLRMLEGAPCLHQDSIMVYRIDNTEETYRFMALEVLDCLASAHSGKIECKFEGVKGIR